MTDEQEYVERDENVSEEAQRLRVQEGLRRNMSKRLYDLMLARGFNQSELARRAGMSRERVSAYLRGEDMPGAAKMLQLAKALKTTSQYIMNGQGDANATSEPSVSSTGDAPALETRAIGGKTFLRVNRLVKNDTALKIQALLHDDPTPSE